MVVTSKGGGTKLPFSGERGTGDIYVFISSLFLRLAFFDSFLTILAFAVRIRMDIDFFKVIDYLVKRGYFRTEAMLRAEMSQQDAEGRHTFSRLEDSGGGKYGRSFGKPMQSTSNTQLDVDCIFRVAQSVYRRQP